MAATELVEIVHLRDEYVTCRTIGHSWDDNPNGEVNSDFFKLARGLLMLRCTRCQTERFDYIGNNMQIFQRYYRYPPQYRSIPGQGTRPNLRAEMFRRSLLIRSYNGKRKRG